MALYHLTDDAHAAAATVPDVMAVDDVAVGTGASIVVAVAATIALVLTMLVATLSSVMPVAAMPVTAAAETVPAPAFDGIVATPATYRITDLAAPRDGTFAVVSKGADGDSLATLVVGGVFLMMLIGSAKAVRELALAAGGPVRPRRHPRPEKPARGR